MELTEEGQAQGASEFGTACVVGVALRKQKWYFEARANTHNQKWDVGIFSLLLCLSSIKGDVGLHLDFCCCCCHGNVSSIRFRVR